MVLLSILSLILWVSERFFLVLLSFFFMGYDLIFIRSEKTKTVQSSGAVENFITDSFRFPAPVRETRFAGQKRPLQCVRSSELCPRESVLKARSGSFSVEFSSL